MRISNIIIYCIFTLMAYSNNTMGNGSYDFGTISKDTTLFWDGQLPMYTPAVYIYFKTTKDMYLTMQLNGTIYSVQDMSQGINHSIQDYKVEFLSLPPGNYFSPGVVTYNILNKIPYVHARLTFKENKPQEKDDKKEEVIDYSRIPNRFPYEASNYIFVTEPTTPTNQTTASSTCIVTKYFYDALGRLVETVNVDNSPDKKSITTLHGYDIFGRESEIWKPSEDIWDGADDDGYIYPDDVTDAAILFYRDSFPYSKPIYEHNPLERVSGKLSVGKEWRKNDKNKTTEYLFNDDKLNCIRWEEKDGIFKNLGDYKPGEVYITKNSDEDGNVSYTFENQQGKTILIRKMYEETAFDTYYIYEDNGNLRYILPPAFDDYPTELEETEKTMMDYAYMYHYDHRRRCIKKKLPGCDWTFYAYDLADNAILTQDGELRKQGKCLFQIYDKFGRICLEGTCKNKINPQDDLDIDVTAAYTGEGLWGYDIQGLDLTSPTLLNAYYYDNYDFLNTNLLEGTSKEALGVMQEKQQGKYAKVSSKGLLTATLTKVIGEDTPKAKYLSTVFCYDEKGRNTAQISSNIMGGIDFTCNTYDFRGKVVEKQIRHILGKKNISETFHNEYDHAERLKEVSYSIDGGTPVIIASYSYDNVGRLSEEVLGEKNPIRYKYNIRDWMNEISSGSFKQKLFFEEDAPERTETSKRYNGNISAIQWSTNDKRQAYTFTYDGMDRLLYADHLDYNSYTDKYSTEYEYDKNGNVTYLMRMGMVNNQPDILHELYFAYDGNQLINVRDGGKGNIRKGESTLGSENGSSVAGGREYDGNGNVIREDDKGITSIRYNVLNLPSQITFKNGNAISYLYSGKGEKLRVTYKTAPTMAVSMTEALDIATSLPEASYTFDTLSYCGNITYHNGSLLRILNETGFATPNDSLYDLHYFIKDHLGSVRILADSKGNVEQAIDYYPFGSIIAESKNSELQPYLYNGKEFDKMNGLDWHDYGARMLENDGIRWGQVDPKAEVTPSVSPYVYCNDNPIKRIDMNGMLYGDYYDSKGKLLGSDGRNDKNIYVIRASNNAYFETYGEVKVNGIKNKQKKAAIQELQKHNGDSSYDFTNVQNSFVKLDGSQEIRKEVVSFIKDDGKGGTSDANNREYGMNFEKENPATVYHSQGNVAKPGDNVVSAYVPIREELISIHTHPSGKIIPNLMPAPSNDDVGNAFTGTNSYVIDMSNKVVYIYDNSGILSSFPLTIYTK